MTTHELKLDIKYFDDVKSGKKNFGIQKNDRDFQFGDILKLRAYGESGYMCLTESFKKTHEKEIAEGRLGIEVVKYEDS